MRKSPATSTTTPFASPTARSFDRRALPKVFAEFTCIVLFKHHETAKALLVSTDGEAVGAVWCPKAMLGINPVDRGRFLVATVSKAFAGQKRIDVGHFSQEWIERLLPEELAQFADAMQASKRNRQQFNGYRRSELSHFGRNEFA